MPAANYTAINGDKESESSKMLDSEDKDPNNDFVLKNETHLPKIDSIEQPPTLRQRIQASAKQKAQNVLTKKTLYKRVPVLTWFPQYNMEKGIGDLVAGITVGLTVIPQALAYSNIAGVPTEYGMYGSFLGCFVYIVFGSCKDVPMGPTAITSLLTFQAIQGHGPQHAILLCFLTGVIQILMGLFGLGFMIDFISGPVSSGFTSAVALIIVTSQVKDILAIQGSGSTFITTWINLFQNMKNTVCTDTIFGLICIAVLLLMRRLANIKVGPPKVEEQETWHKVANKTLWLVSTARNAILVIVCGFIGYAFTEDGKAPFRLIGEVPPGLPAVKLPPFGYTEVGINGTEVHYSLGQMLGDLGSGILVLPLVGLLEDIAICKAFSTGKAVDATQELLAIGLSNLANSFVQGYPGSGALARSAVNNASGVRTTFGGLYTGLLVIGSLLFFTPYFYYVPKASLAALIIAAVIFMVEYHAVKPIWQTSRTDLVPGLSTFIACLVIPLQYGILVGIAINIMFVLYHAARPKIKIEELVSNDGTEYLMLTPDRHLIFPSVDYVRNLVTKHSLKQATPVILDCTYIYKTDYTAAKAIQTLIKDFASRDQPLYFFNPKASVTAVFESLSSKSFVVIYTQEQIDELIRDNKIVKEDVVPA